MPPCADSLRPGTADANETPDAGTRRKLRTIKTAHTLVWAFFVACILGIPIAAQRERFRLAFALAALVAVEVLVLLLNRWSCPLTPIAARHTRDRSPNFDIYLPRWLAQHNKAVFGALYVAGLAYAVWRWA